MNHREVHQAHLMLLLAAMVGCVQVQDRAVTLSNERNSIERTYELTKYLDHQLKEIKDTYLLYLGPPFSDPDFSPPRPNISSLAVPSAATRVELWRGLENGARLAQNQRAYSVLLCAVRELARSTLCPYLQSSLLHFCSGLSGLLGSISGLMNALGYTPPLHGNAPPSQKYVPPLASTNQRENTNGPAPLRSHAPRSHGVQSGLATGGTRGPTHGSETEKKRDRERERGERGERGRRGRRREGESWAEREEEEREEGLERWGRKRRLLSVEEHGKGASHNYGQNNATNTNTKANMNNTHIRSMNYFSQYDEGRYANISSMHSNGQFTTPSLMNRDRRISEEEEVEGFRENIPLLFSSPSLHSGRSERSVPSPPHPTFSPLALLYPYEGVAADGHTPLTTPALSPRPALNDFTRKVEGFWVLRELQSWLWRSAKDFTRLKKRLRA